MEVQLGVFGVLPITHTQKQMQTKCIQNLRAPCGISCMFIFTLRPQYIRTWRIMIILIVGKTRIPPIGAPCLDKDGAGSGISGLYLWSVHIFETICKWWNWLLMVNAIYGRIRYWQHSIIKASPWTPKKWHEIFFSQFVFRFQIDSKWCSWK